MPTTKTLPGEPWLPIAKQTAREFPGMVSNLDPHDLPAGAMTLQVNLLPRRPGTLETRGALRLLRFED
jgi:hypothetical protein